jgi:hypothetical protein
MMMKKYIFKKGFYRVNIMGGLKKGGTFIERELYQSEAFNSLGKVAIKVLIAFMDKRMREKTSMARDKKNLKRKPKFINLDSISLTYGELEKKYGILRQSATRAFDELLAKGFIEIRHQGGAYKHDKSVYALVDKWMFWRKGAPPFSERKKDAVHRGYQGDRRKSNVINLDHAYSGSA